MEHCREQRLEAAALRRILEENPDNSAGVILRLAWFQGLTREEIGKLTWAQVSFQDREIQLSDRAIPLETETMDCLRRWQERFEKKSPFVLCSRGTLIYMAPESISRAARTALDRGGLPSVRLTDLRRDFMLRMIETHGWPYAARVGGLSVSTLQSQYAHLLHTREELLETEGDDGEIDEFKLWKLLQREGDSLAGLALWLSWQMGLRAREIVALTWSQVDLDRGMLSLPGREIPLSNTVRRLLKTAAVRQGAQPDAPVLLTPESRRPLDLPRLSRLTRTALIRGGMEHLTLRDLRRDEARHQEETRLLEQAAEQGGISRSQAAELLGISGSAAYLRLRSLTERKKLTRVGEKYYIYGTVPPQAEQERLILNYLRENGAAYRQDIAVLLRIGERQSSAVLRRMTAAGTIQQKNQRYFLPETVR